MPATSEKQRRFMGAELARSRAGKKTRTGMSEDALSEFAAKSMDMIDAYLFKHGRILPCGHHAEEGSDIDKACTMSNCGGAGGTGNNSQMGKSGTVYAKPTVQWGSAPGGGSMGIHATAGAGGSGGAGSTGSGTMTSSSPPEGGFQRSADPINLIDRYLDKQSRSKCKHKKGDPNHLEAA